VSIEIEPPGAAPIPTRRGRPPRAEVHANERRRRRAGSLNRMAQYKLDIFSPEQLDPRYIYRWVSDEASRLRMVTKQDDYDFVNADEIPDFSPDDETDSEPGGRVRIISGEKKNGQPLYQYLVKKRRDFWEEDNRASMSFRDDTLKGRVYKGDVGAVPVGIPKDGKVERVEAGGVDPDAYYVPPEASLGSVRRGPVQP
jgi:hypothetical protein